MKRHAQCTRASQSHARSGRARNRPFRPVLAVLAAALVAGCAATAIAVDRPDPDAVLSQAVRSAADGHFIEAHSDLSWVYTHYASRPVGRRALLALAALELDPRNPQQRLDVGAQLLERFFDADSLSTVPAWERPVLETMYLLSVDLGAEEYRLARAHVVADSLQAAGLTPAANAARPTLPRPSMAVRLDSVVRASTVLKQRGDSLETRVKQLESQLGDARKELERIRKTLHG